LAGIDDAKLLELASEQQDELFPTLKRGNSVAPLVALLAILPSLYALAHNSLDANDAQWGLKSLELLAAPDLESVLMSPGSGENHSARQPPLGSWLTALTMLIPGLPTSVGLAIVSFLSTAGIVAIWYLLCDRLAGPRFAFWGTAMIACHGPLLAQVQSPAPTALAILLAMCAFWGFFAHLQDAEGIVSVKLLMAGIALGLCLLAGGFLAVAVLVVDALLAVVMLIGTGSARNGSHRYRSHGPGRWTALKSLPVLASIAVGVSGWWVLLMASQSEPEFWPVWFGFGQPSAMADHLFAADVSGMFVLIVASVHQLIDLLGAFFGLALYGLWRAARELWQCENKSRRWSLKFLCVWLVCALPAWYASLSMRAESADLWRMFVLLPLVGFAAFAIEQVIERRTRPLVALWLFCLSILIPEWSAVIKSSASGETPGSIREATVVMTAWLATGFALLSVWLVVFARRRDHRQRICLTGALLLIVWLNASQGLQSIRLTADERRSRRMLTEFHDSLASTGPIDDQVLITDSDSPAVIEFVVRSVRPELVLHTVPNWNEVDLLIREAQESGVVNRTVLIVDWRTIGRSSTRPPGGNMPLKRHSTPVIWHGRRLTTYLLTGPPL
jgi:hypothetical protein